MLLALPVNMDVLCKLVLHFKVTGLALELCHCRMVAVATHDNDALLSVCLSISCLCTVALRACIVACISMLQGNVA